MPSMSVRAAFALAALVASAALARAQDEEPAPAPAPAAKPAEEPRPEVKGNRFRLTLKSGAKIEGVLPGGLVWEKRDQVGEFVEATETEKGAGLRLNYVLNMEGETFIKKAEIAEVKDLGALTDEQKLAIQESIISAKKKALAERERVNREELAKIAALAKEQDAKAKAKGKGKEGEAAPDSEEAKKAAKEAKDRKRGDELLKKFPADEWSPKTIEEINRRSVVNGIFPSADEQEFIDNIDLWKDAVARAEKAAAAKEAGEDVEEEGAGEPEKKPEAKEPEKKPAEKYKVPPAEFKKKGE